MVCGSRHKGLLLCTVVFLLVFTGSKFSIGYLTGVYNNGCSEEFIINVGPSSQRTDKIDYVHYQSQSLGLYQRCHFQDRCFLACRTADTEPELFLLLPFSHKHGFRQKCWAALSTEVWNRQTQLYRNKTVDL